MTETVFYSTNYYLKYKDEKVLEFNIGNQSLKVLNQSYLPFIIHNMKPTFDMIRVFCSNRILMLNRDYCKEILDACGIDDQTDIAICIMSKALSFRDNYWITPRTSAQTWADVNLYQNKFSSKISKVALTGDMSDVGIQTVLSDKVFTGELTTKGTKAKCYLRCGNELLLLKKEKLQEIQNEILSYYIADLMNLSSSRYILRKILGVECSVCRIFTSEVNELLPCRDIMSAFNEQQVTVDSSTYAYFMKADAINFIKMQLFDYITLNTDRNRDNYGLLMHKRNIHSLYPIFDHDSCFKGKGNNAVYFVTSVTFKETLDYIKTTHSNILNIVRKDIENLKEKLNMKFCLEYISYEQYKLMLKQIDRVLN